MERDYKALEAEMKKKKVESRAKEIEKRLKEAEGMDCGDGVLESTEEEVQSQSGEIEKRLKEAEGMDCEDAVVESEVEEVQSKMEVVGCELQKKEKFEKCRLIIHILVLLLKITVDNFPFALYYLDLYDRYRKIRRTVRHCLAVYPHDDAYRDSLLELNRVLTAVIEDKRIKSLVKVLKADYKIFEKLREILENSDKKPREVVEGRMRRFLRYMEKKAAKEKKYASLVSQIKKFWNGLFHTYDHEYIPRTNNDMEQFIGRFRRKWKRITGCSRMNEWIIHRAPMAIYMFNIIGKDSPLNKLGFDTDLANMLSSVSYATYKKCMKEYEVRKEDDRIRKRGNHDLDSVLKEVEVMNELVSVGSEM